MAAADAVKLRRAAHSAKGQLSYVQAHAARESAMALEAEAAAAIEAGPWSDALRERLAALVGQLRVHLDRVDANQRAALLEYA